MCLLRVTSTHVQGYNHISGTLPPAWGLNGSFPRQAAATFAEALSALALLWLTAGHVTAVS